MLEIITVLNIRDNNVVLIINWFLIFIFNFVLIFILLFRNSQHTWTNLKSHGLRTIGITRYLVHNIKATNPAVYYTWWYVYCVWENETDLACDNVIDQGFSYSLNKSLRLQIHSISNLCSRCVGKYWQARSR